MIEINLVEKKKTNASPYVLIGISIISALLIGIGFFLYQNYLDSKQESLMKVRTKNSIHLNEISQESEVIQKVNVLERHIEQLQGVIFPSAYVVQQAHSILPDQSSIEHYMFTITDGLRVSVKAESIDDTSKFAQAMRGFAFVEQADLVELEQIEDEYLAVFTFSINKDSLLKEAD
ncbi:hypothetical protein [Paraliobacillus sp. JSM ZJ581]|uniref:hypothetical protein n=1 Tax=Paraliobacillus sp. JSM ZJ581 TaxID=3342118 RepID=UPI0035A85B74